MTSLTMNSLSDQRVPAVVQQGAVIQANTPSNSSQSASAKPAKLPYQANHQVELLHLQAEIEALLQELRSLQQQRLAATHSASSGAQPTPALAAH